MLTFFQKQMFPKDNRILATGFSIAQIDYSLMKIVLVSFFLNFYSFIIKLYFIKCSILAGMTFSLML